jgi:transposase|tara:strand:+ start:323 stop:1597 length:1275 start_codon:yes stop_codon:yes gene_type:complete
MKHQLFIGIDRSDQCLDSCIIDTKNNIINQLNVSTNPRDLTSWCAEILKLKDSKNAESIAICIEQPCQNLTHFFKQYEEFTLYLINPVILKRYRETFNLSRSKDDKKDALHLALLISEHHEKLTPWKALEPNYQKLSMLTEKRRQLINARTALSNRLTQNLKEYYPQAIELLGRQLSSSISIAFLRRWTSLQKLQKSQLSTIKKFYYLNHCRSNTAIDKRLKIIPAAIPLCSDEVIIEVHSIMTIAYIDQLAALEKNIQRLDDLIEETHKQCDKHQIIESFPGAGQHLSPRITAFMGLHSEGWEKAEGLQCQSGVAPVTKQSGKTHFVHKRYACSTFVRQTFVEYAGQSYKYSTWAKAYYEQQKSKGKTHQIILRGLAYKWQRIIFKCWKNGELYDEEKYLKALQKSGSDLTEIIRNQPSKKCA